MCVEEQAKSKLRKEHTHLCIASASVASPLVASQRGEAPFPDAFLGPYPGAVHIVHIGAVHRGASSRGAFPAVGIPDSWLIAGDGGFLRFYSFNLEQMIYSVSV
jgi:hypothetical protein